MTEERSDFTSKLEIGRQRFLAHAIEHALAVGRRSPLDFIRHFSPNTIMEALAERKDLRAGLLVPTTGLKHKIAIKKTWQSSAEDLQSALDEGETDAAAIVRAFDPDDRVRYLDDKKLWSFLVEGEFWKASATGGDAATARAHVAFLVDRALIDALITARDAVDAISINQLSSHLPRAQIGKLVQATLDAGRASKPFTDADLLAALPPTVIVEHLPLSHVFEALVHAKIAVGHDFIEKAPQAPQAAAPESKKPRTSTKPPPSEDPDWVEIPESTR